MILDQLPKDLGSFPITWNENSFYLYLPIKMAARTWSSNDIKIPIRLKPFTELIWEAIRSVIPSDNSGGTFQKANEQFARSYLYLTVKHMLVNPDFWGNRGGAHADGFGTDDLNWIWYDKNPTEFNSGPFDVSEDEHISLQQFEEQWKHQNTVTYPEQHLLELNSKCVHRIAAVTRYDMRTFVKISLSEHKYNLIGNSHNHLFDYEWEMHDREALRNQTHNHNADYVPDDIA